MTPSERFAAGNGMVGGDRYAIGEHHRSAPTSAAHRFTAGELRVLYLLPTHLSFRHIADEVSRPMSTVTSQAQSIYRKLGATSRHDAVERARVASLERHCDVGGVGSVVLSATRAPGAAKRGALPSAAFHLTPAELRLPELLPTHLSYPQIADEIDRSTTTVKSYAQGIYRKLGATARHDAVERAWAAGLLAGEPS
jgi:DNA-binding NarL/FixJ family response regulator